MLPNNVCSLFLSGNTVETVSYDCAIYWPEFGEIVWFISPIPFNTLPSGWKQPENKEILKLIYFMYIPETKDLLSKLSNIHMILKQPKIIIISNIEHYLFSQSSNVNLTNAAFIISCLIDSVSVYSTKFGNKSFLITSCKHSINQSLQTIVDLYFSHKFNVDDNTYSQIEDIFKTF